MLNWYAMGANAPSFIDEARGREQATRRGDDYEARELQIVRNNRGLSRSGTIRTWRA